MQHPFMWVSAHTLRSCSRHRRKDRQEPEQEKWEKKKKKKIKRKWFLNFKNPFRTCIAQHQEEKQKYSANSSRNVDQILSQIDDTTMTVIQKDLDGNTLHYKESVITMRVNVNFPGNYNNKAL